MPHTRALPVVVDPVAAGFAWAQAHRIHVGAAVDGVVVSVAVGEAVVAAVVGVAVGAVSVPAAAVAAVVSLVQQSLL